MTSAIRVRCSTNWAMKPHIGSVALINDMLSIRTWSFFWILFFVLSLWAKDGCKVETSVSETVCKCTRFSTFALIMKVEEKVTRSIGHFRILGMGLELACKWGQCRESFQMQMSFIFFFNDISPHEPPLPARSSPPPRIRTWSIIITLLGIVGHFAG